MTIIQTGKIAVIIILALSVLIAGSGYIFGLKMTFTGSYPSGVYIKQSGEAKKGDLVLSCPEVSEKQKTARSRGYLPYGTCPGFFAPLLKKVAARDGDVVSIQGAGITVNGAEIKNTQRLTFDSQGRLLPFPVAGVVQPGKVWLVSDYNPKSYDSRYFGAVPTTSIISRVVPVFTIQ